jgi:hypothetical protein
MKRRRRLRRLVPDAELIRRRAAGEPLCSLASDTYVAPRMPRSRLAKRMSVARASSLPAARALPRIALMVTAGDLLSRIRKFVQLWKGLATARSASNGAQPVRRPVSLDSGPDPASPVRCQRHPPRGLCE